MIEILNIQDENGYGLMHGRYDVLAKLPDGATNGDMIKAMFPNGKEYDNDGDVRYEIEIDFDYSFCSYFDGVWWNSPYKKEVEE
jgi:hypothetical protein